VREESKHHRLIFQLPVNRFSGLHFVLFIPLCLPDGNAIVFPQNHKQIYRETPTEHDKCTFVCFDCATYE